MFPIPHEHDAGPGHPLLQYILIPRATRKVKKLHCISPCSWVNQGWYAKILFRQKRLNITDRQDWLPNPLSSLSPNWLKSASLLCTWEDNNSSSSYSLDDINPLTLYVPQTLHSIYWYINSFLDIVSALLRCLNISNAIDWDYHQSHVQLA